VSPSVDAAVARAEMVERQLRRRGITDERVLAAMGRVPRELFVPEGLRRYAYDDGALPIGCRQTISQPFVVATICSLLDLRGTERELAEEARSRLREAGCPDVEVRVGDGSLGVPELAPFEAIAVGAAAPGIPHALYDQLADGGRLVVPRGSRRGQDLVLVVRTPDGPVERSSISCRFVPLLGDEGFGDD
jgi:protein-L-isoaspartate(D-aspartate) O-methyltransferase